MGSEAAGPVGIPTRDRPPPARGVCGAGGASGARGASALRPTWGSEASGARRTALRLGRWQLSETRTAVLKKKSEFLVRIEMAAAIQSGNARSPADLAVRGAPRGA